MIKIGRIWRVWENRPALLWEKKLRISYFLWSWSALKKIFIHHNCRETNPLEQRLDSKPYTSEEHVTGTQWTFWCQLIVIPRHCVFQLQAWKTLCCCLLRMRSSFPSWWCRQISWILRSITTLQMSLVFKQITKPLVSYLLKSGKRKVSCFCSCTKPWRDGAEGHEYVSLPNTHSY